VSKYENSACPVPFEKSRARGNLDIPENSEIKRELEQKFAKLN
jgi:hypothetical protein